VSWLLLYANTILTITFTNSYWILVLSERVKLLVVTGINQLADYLLKNCHLASYCVTISYREMSDIEFLVTCSVCVCNYNDESRKQKFLPCLHSFCQSCLTVSEKRNKLSVFFKVSTLILLLIIPFIHSKSNNLTGSNVQFIVVRCV
jgi:hypothetical protein